MTSPPQPLLGVNGRLFVSWNEDLVVLAIVVPVLKVLKIVVVGNNNWGRSDQFHPLKSLQSWFTQALGHVAKKND